MPRRQLNRLVRDLLATWLPPLLTGLTIRSQWQRTSFPAGSFIVRRAAMERHCGTHYITDCSTSPFSSFHLNSSSGSNFSNSNATTTLLLARDSNVDDFQALQPAVRLFLLRWMSELLFQIVGYNVTSSSPASSSSSSSSLFSSYSYAQ